MYTKAERKAYSKSIKQAKRIKQKQKAFSASVNSKRQSKVDYAVSGLQKDHIDCSKYLSNSRNTLSLYKVPSSLTASGSQKRTCKVKELIRI
ncbi:hypothetical protein HPC38_02450 [Pasteurellaceae bacterium HPA106]|uniref:hypothetical protein n=1 Tax=Spirabiliibacterium pneumoniae TaxID=221400 RepID=UPI001AACFC83|nr:hypothetical protein [Spirabiliibacterium pneumoniae]MBE2895740.1 hypothetical protein [Spirabiliibacterium pneumoniae]